MRIYFLLALLNLPLTVFASESSPKMPAIKINNAEYTLTYTGKEITDYSLEGDTFQISYSVLRNGKFVHGTTSDAGTFRSCQSPRREGKVPVPEFSPLVIQNETLGWIWVHNQICGGNRSYTKSLAIFIDENVNQVKGPYLYSTAIIRGKMGPVIQKDHNGSLVVWSTSSNG